MRAWSDWESANPEIVAAIGKMHADMRAAFGIPALILEESKLKEVKKEMYLGRLPDDDSCLTCGHPGTVATYHGGQACVITQSTAATFPVAGGGGGTSSLVPLAQEEKTLLAKPHPKDCICPKCPKPDLIVKPPVMRIGDAERNATLELLRERHGTGHITLGEFERRADLVLAVTTQPDLDKLTADLPPLPPPVTASAAVSGKPVTESTPRRFDGRHRAWYLASALLFLGNAGFCEIVAHSGILCAVLLMCSLAVTCTWLAKR